MMFIEVRTTPILKSLGVKPTWWWVMRSKNGQIIATSEMYNRRGNALKIVNKIAKAMNIQVKFKHAKG